MGSLPARPAFAIKKVAIVGGGPAGVIAAKHLRSRPCFTDVVVFEQQAQPGGIWNYTDQTYASSAVVPQLSPFSDPDPPVRLGSQPDQPPIFPSPLYDNLHANLPGTLMELVDQKFPPGTRAFPSRQAIRQFLLDHAEEVKPLVRFSFAVEEVRLRTEGGRDRWDLRAKSLVGDEVVRDTFDAVVVANGHYSVPFVPDVKNIREFHTAHPGIISHSKNYRRAEAFRGKKVIVVGNGPSGLDIARQISSVSARPLLLSTKVTTPEAKLSHADAEEISQITEFLVGSRGVRLADGRVEDKVDAVVFCTGYLYSFPFLADLAPQILKSGKSVHNLYEHLFYIPHPTLVFPGLPMSVSPLPVCDAQAALFSAIWSNDLELPPVDEMKKWSENLEAEKGEILHRFAAGADGVYINALSDWAARAKKPAKKPTSWDDKTLWQRSVFVEAKIRFEKQGAKATTLEELGLCYEPSA